MDEQTISSIEELETYAKSVLGNLSSLPHEGAVVLALTGDLGAGKTAFVKAVAKELGITEHITSPTFVIMKMYETPVTNESGFKRLVHIDAYRLESAHELEVLGWNELLADPDALIAIEWPEKVPGTIPNNAHHFTFEHIDETTRKIIKMD
jgi:tRNA threonylcarbamoyladenosine biosynthesis protein TsaE